MCCGERQLGRVKSNDEWADVGGLLAIKVCGNVWAWSAANGYVWVCGPDAVVVGCLCPWLLLPLRALRMPEFWEINYDCISVQGTYTTVAMLV